jgi:hypothetical protein
MTLLPPPLGPEPRQQPPRLPLRIRLPQLGGGLYLPRLGPRDIGGRKHVAFRTVQTAGSGSVR